MALAGSLWSQRVEGRGGGGGSSGARSLKGLSSLYAEDKATAGLFLELRNGNCEIVSLTFTTPSDGDAPRSYTSIHRYEKAMHLQNEVKGSLKDLPGVPSS